MIKKIEGYAAPEFDGRVLRILEHNTVKEVDPFLMLDSFDSNETEVGMGSWHPHRGIETFTYIIRGKMKEKDTINGELEVNEGGALHLSSGSGMYHTSVPTYSEKGIQGFQLWFNIPRKNKMGKPYSSAYQNSDFKHVIENGNDVKVLTGEYNGTVGPFDKSNLGLRILDISIQDEFDLNRETFKNGFVYIYEGEGLINQNEFLETSNAYILDEGLFKIKNTGKQKLKLLFGEGVPLNEPIVWRGPIVMNTQEEIVEAFSELRNNTFIKNMKEQ